MYYLRTLNSKLLLDANNKLATTYDIVQPTTTSTTTAPAIPTTNLIIKLDPTNYTSGTWNDESGNGLNFTINGGFAFESGTNGGVFHSNGASGAYASLANNSLINNYSTGLTWCMWFKNDSGGNDKGIIACDNGTSRRFSSPMNTTNSRLENYLWYTNSAGTATNIGIEMTGVTNLTWYMATISFNCKTGVYTQFLDSTLVDTRYLSPNSTCQVNNTAPFWIGCHFNTSTNAKGYYGHMLFYNRGLTSAEVSSIYNYTKSKYGK